MRFLGFLPIPGFARRIVQVVRRPKAAVPLLVIFGTVAVGALLRWIFGNWLVAAVAALAVVLVVLVGVLVWMLLGQEREARRERGISEEEGEALERRREGEAQRASRERLGTRFARGLAELRTSRLGREAAEALPWYLVIGPSGSGKSALLQACGLDTPAEHARPPDRAPTEHMDWWFTNEAVFLDTTGRYVDSPSETDREEWRRLLRLVRRARSRVALNGVLVALPAPELLERKEGDTEERARELRRRLNDVVDELGVEVPVYVLVTQADRVEGFLELASALAPARLDEALGWTNGERRLADAGDAVARGLGGVRERLDRLLPAMLLREAEPTHRRRLFVLPQELDGLAHALARFARRAFASSVYEETPFLRGVYLTSARCEGRTVSSVLRRLGHTWTGHHVETAGPGRPLFVRELFREIVVGDEDLALPASRLGPRGRRIVLGATALLAAVAVSVGAAGFWTAWSAVDRLEGAANAALVPSPGLATLDRLRETIAESERRTLVAYAGLQGALGVGRKRAKRCFLWAFGREFERPTKARLLGAARRSDERAVEAVAELARDVAWLAEGGKLPDEARPRLVPYSPLGGSERDAADFRAGYDAFVRWLPAVERRARAERERDTLAGVAGRLVDLGRLEQWSQHGTEDPMPVAYAKLGLPEPPPGAREGVPAAYTRASWNSLVSVLLQGVERTGGLSNQELEAFRRAYVRRFDSTWRRYLIDAPDRATPVEEVEDSPYLELLAQIDHNTRAELPREGELPSWVLALRELRREEVREGEEQAPWPRYRAALDQVAADVAAARARPEDALDVAAEVASRDDTSFHGALAVVRDLVPREGGDAEAQSALRRVLSQPVLDGFSAVLESAVQEVDRQWRRRIASRFTGELTEPELRELYAPDGGALARFREQVLGPFFEEGDPVALLEDRRLPTGESFREWMQRADAVQRTLFPGMGGSPRVSVGLEGIPSKITGAEGLFVSRRDLQLTCPDSVETFVYREGAGSSTFPWSPDCQQLTLRIWVRDGSGSERELRPERRWSGPLALPTFFQEGQSVADGRLRWSFRYPEEGVEVEVGYRLRSGRSILRIAHAPPAPSVTE